MNGFNPGEASSYVSHHMMSFVGLDSSSSSNNSCQKQQLWDWETNTTQPPNNPVFPASLFAANSASNPFYGCTAPTLPATAALGGSGYPFHPLVGGDYTAVAEAGLVKCEEDRQQLGLNLGHRTYFPSGVPGGAVDQLLFRRARAGVYQVSHQAPRCQAEGCKADLSGAKHYHRRHKVCELHSKATVVVAGGMQQRFCQQCSRFHLLSEFDEAKRSCRKRLAEHNRRRRKSHPPPPSAPAAGDSSTPQDSSTTSTEKSKQSSPTSVKNTAATTDIITTNASTFPTTSRANISLEEPKDYQKRVTHLRNGPALSLGGAQGADKGGFGFQSHHYHQQMPWSVMSDENNRSQQQQQQRISSSSSSSSIFFQPQNYFCSSTNEASQSTASGHQDNPLQLGQGMLEVDFI